VLAHLDPDVLGASPKPFFGYSDNTNLHLFLWNLGLVSGTPNRRTSSPAAEPSPLTAGPGRSW